MSLKIIHTKNLRWIDIMNPGKEEIDYLKKNFDFHPLDYEDILGNSQHTKMETHKDYSLLVLLFPVYNRQTKEISPGEVDFFVGKDYLITIHDGAMYTLVKLVNSTHTELANRQEFMSKNSGYLLYQILESLFRRSFPILDHINKDMNEIEKNVFWDLSLRMLENISLMKRNIIDFRRIMKTHHLVIKRLIQKKETYLTFTDSKVYYSNLLEHSESIWDILAIQKETIEALQDASTSLATNRLNKTTKIVTILSALFLPATFVMFMFGVKTASLPLEHNPYGFEIIVAISVGSSVLTYILFKKKKWL
ncbi:MAG: yfjQ [Candidatus Doudnabacteria bacterium]|nr:yfjQ [Candidatus Doudnabacteria bacterium]